MVSQSGAAASANGGYPNCSTSILAPEWVGRRDDTRQVELPQVAPPAGGGCGGQGEVEATVRLILVPPEVVHHLRRLKLPPQAREQRAAGKSGEGAGGVEEGEEVARGRAAEQTRQLRLTSRDLRRR